MLQTRRRKMCQNRSSCKGHHWSNSDLPRSDEIGQDDGTGRSVGIIVWRAVLAAFTTLDSTGRGDDCEVVVWWAVPAAFTTL